MRRLIGRIRNGVYEHIEDDTQATPTKSAPHGSERTDYFGGVTPSQLKQLDGDKLYVAAERIYDALERRTGTPREQALAAEAYQEVVREARGRRQTLRR